MPVLLVALLVSQLVPRRVFMCPTRFQVIPEGTEQVKIFAHANRMLDFWYFPLKNKVQVHVLGTVMGQLEHETTRVDNSSNNFCSSCLGF